MCLASVFPAGRALEFGHLEAGFHFVPEGQHDRSQARSAWNHEENSLVPAGRLNPSRLRLGTSGKNVEKTSFSFEMPNIIGHPQPLLLSPYSLSRWD